MSWKKARKKPVEVEYKGPFTDPDVIETIEGDFEVDKEYIEEHAGFVIIRGVEGEIYPCALDIFNETYEKNSTQLPEGIEDPEGLELDIL